MTKLLVSLSILLKLSIANAEDREDWYVDVYCDAATSRVSIGDANDFGLDGMRVEWPEISQGPEVSPGGSQYRNPSKTNVYQCGKYTVNVSMDFLNANPDGAEGLVTFKAVEIYLGNSRIVPQTGFYDCDVGSRYECPKYFARNIDVQYDARRKRTNVLLHREYYPKSFLFSSVTKDTKKYSVPDKH